MEPMDDRWGTTGFDVHGGDEPGESTAGLGPNRIGTSLPPESLASLGPRSCWADAGTVPVLRMASTAEARANDERVVLGVMETPEWVE